MKYDRTCSASGMFVANTVMSFIKINYSEKFVQF